MGFMASVVYWAPLGWLVLGVVAWVFANRRMAQAVAERQLTVSIFKRWYEASTLYDYGARDEARELIDQIIHELKDIDNETS